MADRDAQLSRGFEAYWAQRYSDAFPLLLPFAERGHVDAQCAVASMYQLGLGVAGNGTEAVRWYKLAAGAGSDLACNNLWCIYSGGCFEVPQDKVEARMWYDEAKRRGFAHLPREFY